jgi:hypothetical protein
MLSEFERKTNFNSLREINTRQAVNMAIRITGISIVFSFVTLNKISPLKDIENIRLNALVIAIIGFISFMGERLVLIIIPSQIALNKDTAEPVNMLIDANRFTFLSGTQVANPIRNTILS